MKGQKDIVNMASGVFVVGILIIAFVIVFSSLNDNLDFELVIERSNETMTILVNESANTTFGEHIANVQTVTLANGSNPYLTFQETNDYTVVDVLGEITWVNSTFNNTEVNVTYNYTRFAEAAAKGTGNSTSMFANVSTQLPTIGTIIGVTVLLFLISVGIFRLVNRRSG